MVRVATEDPIIAVFAEEVQRLLGQLMAKTQHRPPNGHAAQACWRPCVVVDLAKLGWIRGIVESASLRGAPPASPPLAQRSCTALTALPPLTHTSARRRRVPCYCRTSALLRSLLRSNCFAFDPSSALRACPLIDEDYAIIEALLKVTCFSWLNGLFPKFDFIYF